MPFTYTHYQTPCTPRFLTLKLGSMSYSLTVILHAVLTLASCCLVPINTNSVLSSLIKVIINLSVIIQLLKSSTHSLKWLWTEYRFSLVLKFAFKNTRCQCLRSLGLQAFKFVPFYPQKWYLNRAAKIPRDINFWRHFGATIGLAIWQTRRKRDSEGGNPRKSGKSAHFGIAGHVFLHILPLANKTLYSGNKLVATKWRHGLVIWI